MEQPATTAPYSVFIGVSAQHQVFIRQELRNGLKRTDRSAGGKLVQISALDVNGNPGTFWGYEEQFEIDHGLVVKDYRQAGRICNIDVAD